MASSSQEVPVDATCGYSPPVDSVFLAGYPQSLGCDPWIGEREQIQGCAARWPYNRSSLASAQAWCCAHADCGGVTLQYGLYEARSGRTAFKGGFGSPTSWLCVNRSVSISVEDQWFERYGARRYGRLHPAAVDAWRLLGATIYSGIGGGFGSAISSAPSLDMAATDGREMQRSSGGDRGGTSVAARAAATNLLESYAIYNTEAGNMLTVLAAGSTATSERLQMKNSNGDKCGCCQVCACSCAWDAANGAVSEAWGGLLAASDALGSVASYRFDLVDIGRYVIGGRFSTVWGEYVTAFQQRNVSGCHSLEQTCLEILDDYETLLSADANFQLGRWLNWSLSWSRSVYKDWFLSPSSPSCVLKTAVHYDCIVLQSLYS